MTIKSTIEATGVSSSLTLSQALMRDGVGKAVRVAVSFPSEKLRKSVLADVYQSAVSNNISIKRQMRAFSTIPNEGERVPIFSKMIERIGIYDLVHTAVKLPIGMRQSVFQNIFQAGILARIPIDERMHAFRTIPNEVERVAIVSKMTEGNEQIRAISEIHRQIGFARNVPDVVERVRRLSIVVEQSLTLQGQINPTRDPKAVDLAGRNLEALFRDISVILTGIFLQIAPSEEVRSLSDLGLRINLLWVISRSIARCGDRIRAVAVIMEMPESPEKERAFQKMIMNVVTWLPEGQRGFMLQDISISLNRNSEPERAIYVAKMIPDVALRESVLHDLPEPHEIPKILLKKGKIDKAFAAALRIFEKESDFQELFKAAREVILKRVDSALRRPWENAILAIEEEIASAWKITHEEIRNSTLLSISSSLELVVAESIYRFSNYNNNLGELAAAGERAFAIAERIPDPLHRDYSIAHICQPLMQAGIMELVLNIAEKISDKKLRWSTVKAALAILIQANRLQRAVSIVERYITEEPLRWSALAHISKAYLMLDDRAEAIRVVKKIRDPVIRESLLQNLN